MSLSSMPKTPATITATVLDLLVATCMLPLSYLEHVKSFRPSGLLSAFILLTLLLNIAQMRMDRLRGVLYSCFCPQVTHACL